MMEISIGIYGFGPIAYTGRKLIRMLANFRYVVVVLPRSMKHCLTLIPRKHHKLQAPTLSAIHLNHSQNSKWYPLHHEIANDCSFGGFMQMKTIGTAASSRCRQPEHGISAVDSSESVDVY